MSANQGDDSPWSHTDGVVVAGHGVASGRKRDPRFPDGTLALQIPFFAARGLDLAPYWQGTLNVSIAPARYGVGHAAFTFRNVKWHPDEPAEDFSFFECRLGEVGSGAAPVSGWIYYPHPETKPEHFQAADVLEVIAPRIKKIGAGSRVGLSTPTKQMSFQSG